MSLREITILFLLCCAGFSITGKKITKIRLLGSALREQIKSVLVKGLRLKSTLLRY